MPPQERNFDRRPDPDALLAVAEAATRGKLRIFLGAAPGVGKTYAMLERARACRADGVDVVIGLVETHGAPRRRRSLEGLEILPRRKVDYHGRVIEEFDLDAALARKPKLIVVDELAHTNAPDSRHPKRWQDVEELLDAGIDVWTALNIQHLESLADVVARITGVRVRETVPDRVLAEAADVVLVDITPDELIQRLHEGKVYLPQTAQARDAEFLHARQSDGAARTRLAPHRRARRRPDGRLSAPERDRRPVGDRRTTAGLRRRGFLLRSVVRAGARLATGLNAEWIAVFVERPARRRRMSRA